MKLLQFPKHWWKYPIRFTVMEKFLWKTSSMEDRNFQSFRFLDYVYLCRRLQRNIGMKGCREKPTCLLYTSQAGVTEVPTTYSEFREACKKVTEMGNGNVYGLIDGGKQMNRMDVMARSLAAAAGGKVAATQKVLTDNGVAPYDSKEMNDALGFIKGLVDDGSIHPDTINISCLLYTSRCV